MSVTLAKWGNAIGVRIPSYLIKRADLHPGDTVDVKLLESGEILLKPAHKKLLLKELVAGITKKNCHSEIDWGENTGNEVW